MAYPYDGIISNNKKELTVNSHNCCKSQLCYAKRKKPASKYYILYDSNSMTLWKKQNYRGREQSNGVRVQFNSVQSLGRAQLFATPWTAARQTSLSITNFQSIKRQMMVRMWRKREHLCTASVNLNWCNHYGKQYGVSSG